MYIHTYEHCISIIYVAGIIMHVSCMRSLSYLRMYTYVPSFEKQIFATFYLQLTFPHRTHQIADQ